MPVTLIAKRPKKIKYPKELRTWGDHIRKHRLYLGKLQKEVACLIGVNKATIWNWEHGMEPEIRYLPNIVEFLGYVPLICVPKTLGERIMIVRQVSGMSQEELARSIGIDPGTLGKWERDKSRPTEKLFKRLKTKFNF